MEKDLVGRSHECDYPASIKKLPVCSEVHFKVSGDSRDIDSQVKSNLSHGQPFYKIHADVIERLKPDVIITQSHCEVCAVAEKDIERDLKNKISPDLKIVSLRPNGLNDLWVSMKSIAEAAGLPDGGAAQVENLKARISEISKKTQDLPQKPAVASIEWIDPLMSAGNWMPELVQLAGGVNLLGKAGVHSPNMSWEDLQNKNPDIIIILPCGFDLARTREEVKSLTKHPGWFDLPPVLNNKVFLLEGNQYFNRPGPRLVDSLEILAEIFHPEIFNFGYKNEAWEYMGLGH